MFTARCEVQIPPVESLENGKITVGRHVYFSCKPENFQGEFNFKQAYIKAPPDRPYLVKIFSIRPESNGSFLVDVTFYSAGQHSLEQIVLTDGVQEISLAGGPVSVETVLLPPEAGKAQQPYDFLMPLQVATPILYYALLFAVFAGLCALVFFRLRRISFYRGLKNKMETYDSPVAADSQFYKAVRSSEKEGYPLSKLEDAFRLYVLRSYQIPMFDLPDRRILRYFKHNNPAQKEARIALQKVLVEFEEMRARSDIGSGERALFVKKLYRFVDIHRGVRS